MWCVPARPRASRTRVQPSIPQNFSWSPRVGCGQLITIAAGTGSWRADQPSPKLLVVAEADELNETPVVPMPGRVQQSVLPVGRVLPQRIHHLLHRLVKGCAV